MDRVNSIIPQDFKLKDYPALTVGLIPFTFILLIVDGMFGGSLSHTFGLDPFAPFRFDLNKLSFYLLYHQNFFHWLLNIVALAPLMYNFEKTHGTIHTGITLNLLAVATALQYCLVGMILYRNTHVIGLSGVVFLFLTYFAVKEHEFRPILYRTTISNYDVKILTKYSPFVSLFLCAILIPGSSFFGHLFGITSGYLLAYNKLQILYPPLSIILKIEEKLAGLISLLDNLVDFIKELDAASIRTIAYQPRFAVDIETGSSSVEQTATPTYGGEGHVLGSN